MITRCCVPTLRSVFVSRWNRFQQRRRQNPARLELILVRPLLAGRAPGFGAEPAELGVGVVDAAERVHAAAVSRQVELVRARAELAEVKLERREGDLAGRLAVEGRRDQRRAELRDGDSQLVLGVALNRV